ncbi:MAG: Zn-ribbon domain-containing OB-fold protein [Lautropia sp.]
MAYLPAAAGSPDPTIDDKPFWAYCAARELRFQQCAGCGRFRHPPAPACPSCRSFASRWVRARDEAELFSFTVVHYAAHPDVESALPYNVAIVRFPSFDDVRLVSNVIDVDPAALRIGMPLRLVWEEAGSGMPLPRFARRLASEARA